MSPAGNADGSLAVQVASVPSPELLKIFVKSTRSSNVVAASVYPLVSASPPDRTARNIAKAIRLGNILFLLISYPFHLLSGRASNIASLFIEASESEMEGFMDS